MTMLFRSRLLLATVWWIVATTTLCGDSVDSFLVHQHPASQRIRTDSCFHERSLSFSSSSNNDGDENNSNNPQRNTNNWNSPQQQQQRQQEARAKLAQLLNDKTIQGNPQFLYPLDEDDEQAIVEQNYISQYQLEQAFAASSSEGTIHNNSTEGTKNDSANIQTSQPESPMNNVDSFLFENDAVELDSEAYLRLSQYMPQSSDPQRGLPSDNDAYSSVLNQALSQQQNQKRDDTTMNQQRYRAIVQNLAQPPPNSPSSSTRRRSNNQNNNSYGRPQKSSARASFTPNSQQPKSSSQPEPTVNDLMSAWQMASINRNRTSQTLHEQVFAEEEGFRKQSALFRESLIDPSKSRQAMTQRRKAAFDARQSQAQEKLREELQEWEAVFLTSSTNVTAANAVATNNADSERVCCPQCQAILVRPEWERVKKVDNRGQEMCDICYAERHFVDKPQPLRRRRIIRHSQSPGGIATNRRPQMPRRQPYGPINNNINNNPPRRQLPPLLDDWRVQQTPPTRSNQPPRPTKQVPAQQRQSTRDSSQNNDHTDERDYKGWQQQLARDRQKRQQQTRPPPTRPSSTPSSNTRKRGRKVPNPDDFSDVPF